MKNSFKAFIVAAVSLALLSSCTKTEVDNSVYIDSYVHSFLDKSGIPVYSIVHSAYSFTKLNSITVTGTATAVKPLKDMAGDGFSFYSQPDSLSYLPAIPAPESFTYNITYNDGTSAIKTDAVSKSLIPAQQLTAVKGVTEINLTWKAVANSEAYKVRIFSTDLVSNTKTLIYESNFLGPKDATSDLSIPFSLISISSYLSTNLTFEVSAFIFEQGQDTYEAVSVANIMAYYGS
ncbi:MAG: hypothetical protein M0Q53_16930 [Prolixibacteraceae bacterium]|jgi:hypothetical protein|nr:hypothetical protein [Prolixibacteraceae bacterium]